MAQLEVNFISQMFNRMVSFKAILPVDRVAFGTFWPKAQPKVEGFKTLYLLNPGFGNHLDFTTATRIVEWTEARNLAVVMPAAENQFYLDKPERGQYYGRYIAQELVEVTRDMFPLSRKREDTFIAGMSMGGFGAIVNGLKYHDVFSRIGALSPGIINDDILENNDLIAGIGWKLAFLEDIHGGREALKSSDSDPYYLLEKSVREGLSIPDIYMSVGDEDFMQANTQRYKAFLDEKNVPVTYHAAKGQHNWDLWNAELKRLLDWLPQDA